jgi:hypothetical protein
MLILPLAVQSLSLGKSAPDQVDPSHINGRSGLASLYIYMYIRIEPAWE